MLKKIGRGAKWTLPNLINTNRETHTYTYTHSIKIQSLDVIYRQSALLEISDGFENSPVNT